MVTALMRLFFIILCTFSLFACVTEFKPNDPLKNAVDSTKGTYHKNQQNELLLVTMSNDSHHELSEGKPITNQADLPSRYNRFLNLFSEQYNLELVADWPLNALKIRCFVFRSSKKISTQTLAKISAEQHVESAQYLQIFKTTSSNYNDPLIPMQEGFSTMDIEQSHRWGTGKGVKVSIIDTGIDTSHKDLTNTVSSTSNFVDNNSETFKQDIHGTSIAGIISSNANNSEGLVGVAPDASILALKACWQDSATDQDAYCNSYTLAKAINKSISLAVDIINLSLAGPPDPLLKRLVQKAIENNIVVVGAVHPELPVSFPTHVEGVIAAAEAYQNTSEFKANPNVLYVAGNKVISTTPNNKYDFYSGSSISTAHVSGIIALIRQRKPHYSSQQVKTLLLAHQAQENQLNACTVMSTLVGAQDCR